MFSFLEPGFKQPWVQIPMLTPISCVTRDRLLNFSISFLKNRSSKNNFFIVVFGGGFDEIVYISVWYRMMMNMELGEDSDCSSTM